MRPPALTSGQAEPKVDRPAGAVPCVPHRRGPQDRTRSAPRHDAQSLVVPKAPVDAESTGHNRHRASPTRSRKPIRSGPSAPSSRSCRPASTRHQEYDRTPHIKCGPGAPSSSCRFGFTTAKASGQGFCAKWWVQNNTSAPDARRPRPMRQGAQIRRKTIQIIAQR